MPQAEVGAYQVVWDYNSDLTVQAEPSVSIQYEPVSLGDAYIITANYEGFENTTPTFVWQRSTNGTTWSTITGETDDYLEDTLTQGTIGTYFRVIVTGNGISWASNPLEMEELETE